MANATQRSDDFVGERGSCGQPPTASLVIHSLTRTARDSSVRVRTLTRMRIECTVRNHNGDRDVAITAPPGTELGDVEGSLADLLGEQSALHLWAGARALPPTTPLGAPGLRTGDVVTVGTPGPLDPSDAAVLRLHVVGGPDAGRVLALPRGIVTIGRAADCDLVLTDPDVSRRHACLTVTAGGITVHDLDSSNGTTIEGVHVEEEGAAWNDAGLLRAGDSFLSIARGNEPPAALRMTPDGGLLVNRPPRRPAPASVREIEFPVRDDARRAQRMQWAAALLPALAGVGLALALGSAQFLAFALLSPVIVLATSLSDRVHWRRIRRRDAISWRQSEVKAAAEAAEALALEVRLRRRAHPDPALLHQLARTPCTRLWERRRADPDALSVRLGLTELDSAVRARRGPVSVPAGRLPDVPLAIDLRVGPLGVAGPAGIALGIARWLLCQLAVLISPADLELALLLSDVAAAQWTWARWLPHLTRGPATTAAGRRAMIADLGALLEQRLARQRDAGPWTGPWLVVVVDRAVELSDQPGLSDLLSAGSAVGITAICVDAQGRQLPAACVTSVLAAGETGARLDISARGDREPLRAVADRVTNEWADSVARALAPLADGGGAVGNGLPRQCGLLDLLGLDELDDTALRQRWAGSDTGASTVLGMGVDALVRFDLVRDGPHALVAGTTGAGKSELLQSLVAGLALNYAPDAICFVLIDYKGGAAFADCARLPHTVGLVTDLDVQSTERALRSLHSELNRREALFAHLGAVDLTGYRAAAAVDKQLPRLLLVVDEFAALAEELPEFVAGLVAIAQRGRSLGVHLVLATQRPGGVVSPEIRANTALRVALRMSDPAESCDVIGSERAAHLRHDIPGRAVIRIGATVTDLQTARVSGPAAPSSKREISVVPLGPWRAAAGSPGPTSGATTDLQLIVDALVSAAAAAGQRAPRRPWLPPLPTGLSTATLPPATDRCSIAIGLTDRPDLQEQTPLRLDLAEGGSVSITGGPRSGRTTALLTIALVAAQQLGCDELAIYTLDCAGGGLAPLADLPHVGTAATRERFELVDALLRRLEATVHGRQTWLAELGMNSIRDARAAGHRVPLMLCLLDGWDSFVAIAEDHDSGRAVDVFLRLLRAGAAAGLTVVVAGDRATLSARLAGAVATKFVLALADRSDFALAGVPARAVPRHLPPGRAIRASDAVEVQFAYVGAAASGPEQRRAIRAIPPPEPGSYGAERTAPFAPIRLRPLPTRIDLSQLPVTPGRFTIGAAGDGANVLDVDLFAGTARLLVTGPPRSGRSTVLCTLLIQAIRDGIAVVLAARPRTPLARAGETHGVPVLGPESPADPIVPVSPRWLLLVDDSEAFLETAVGSALTNLLRSSTDGLAAVVAANSDELALTYRGVAAEVRRSRCALVLQPGPGDGELVGRRLPQRRAMTPPGRGLLIPDTGWAECRSPEPLPVQVARP
jgi:DNA segregation ATPase FtsK/SpoIIIE, S-DNA-T family